MKKIAWLFFYSCKNRIYLHSDLNCRAEMAGYNMLVQSVSSITTELHGLQSFRGSGNTGWYV